MVWKCKRCNEEQYTTDEIITSGTYTCGICGSKEFIYRHNGINYEINMNNKKILKASMKLK